MVKKINDSLNILLVLLMFISLKTTIIGQNDSKQIKKLTESSELIIVGKVSAKESFWNENKTRITTKVTINPDEYIKGNNSVSEINVNIPGGEIGEIGEIYSHMPKFENDEEVLVFLQRNPKNEYRITGGELGKYRLLRDDKTSERITTSKRKISDLKREIKKNSVE